MRKTQWSQRRGFASLHYQGAKGVGETEEGAEMHKRPNYGPADKQTHAPDKQTHTPNQQTHAADQQTRVTDQQTRVTDQQTGCRRTCNI